MNVEKGVELSMCEYAHSLVGDNSRLICLVYSGSVAYNSFVEGESDIDLIGMYFGPVDVELGACRSPKTLEGVTRVALKEGGGYRSVRVEVTLYPVRRAIGLLAKGSPNLLPLLFGLRSHVLISTEEYESIRKESWRFVSGKVYSSVNGYARGQLKSLEGGGAKNGRRAELVNRHGYDTKAAYHAIRLLSTLVDLYSLGTIKIYRDVDRDFLMSVRMGKHDKKGVYKVINEMRNKLDELSGIASLPDGANMEAIDRLCAKVILSLAGV